MLVSARSVHKRDEPHRDLGADWLGKRNDEATSDDSSPASNASAAVVLGPAASPSEPQEHPGYARALTRALHSPIAGVCGWAPVHRPALRPGRHGVSRWCPMTESSWSLV
jgi:hypothetical protein